MTCVRLLIKSGTPLKVAQVAGLASLDDDIFVKSLVFSYYGCRLLSDIPLLQVPACITPDEPPDAVLTLGLVPKALTDPIWSSPFVSLAADGSALIQVAAVGRFLVRNGCDITIEPAPSAEPVEIETVLMGPVAGVLLHQRGIFPLRASCVELGGVAVAIAGSAACGKSTLAGALIRRGATLISDGVCPVQFSNARTAHALQGTVGLRLWPDSREALPFPEEWSPIRPGHPKQVARLQTPDLVSHRLAAIVRVARSNGSSAPGIRRIYWPAAMSPMEDVVYQFRLGRLLGRTRDLFRDVMRLADMVPIYMLRRPARFERIEEAAGWIADAAGRL